MKLSKYESLIANCENVEINDTLTLPEKVKGFYTDGVILIDKHLPASQKIEILAEEVAHYKVTSGNILDLSNSLNKLFENKARRLSRELTITLDEIVDAHKQGIESLYEMTEYFEVTSHCVKACIDHYKQKYGLSVKHKGYLITFEPLQVHRLTTDK